MKGKPMPPQLSPRSRPAVVKKELEKNIRTELQHYSKLNIDQRQQWRSESALLLRLTRNNNLIWALSQMAGNDPVKMQQLYLKYKSLIQANLSKQQQIPQRMQNLAVDQGPNLPANMQLNPNLQNPEFDPMALAVVNLQTANILNELWQSKTNDLQSAEINEEELTTENQMHDNESHFEEVWSGIIASQELHEAASSHENKHEPKPDNIPLEATKLEEMKKSTLSSILEGGLTPKLAASALAIDEASKKLLEEASLGHHHKSSPMPSPG
ncbi:hypothetical protein [Coxiella burnetii]|uniref:hypothetical protein n=1 Tax=Coxiella burnetii TaxID=777 RepID=UPI000183CE1B|nr:hypothetical protein [Coxiella burnetii]ACJ19928.1 hypothetical protein CbuK_0671 [Coxiella burnetii CbuK_Q154]AZV75722.1 hypothetical protein D6219_07975 [Coxiella burnetii]MDE3400769.1 hypothetical protein [Coxiella burnetii]PHH58269.1 hypothetical protein CRH12_00445 [Coxiella burnetii]PNT86917.1 hypothetical protein C2L93_01250 [Coxiella burnetii]